MQNICRPGSGITINISARLLHNNTSAAIPWPPQRWAACIPTSYIRPENCPRIPAIGFFADIFCFCTQLKRKRKPWCFDLLTRYPICCTDWKTCWENFSNYFVWELTNVYTLHRQLYVHCLNYSISQIKPLFKLFTSIHLMNHEWDQIHLRKTISFFILHKVWTWYFQDRVSRVLFPSTFILLNIIYWLVFSDILDSLHSSSELSSYPSQWIL